MKNLWKIITILLVALVSAFVTFRSTHQPVQAAEQSITPTFAVYTDGTIQKIYEDEFEIFYLDTKGNNRIVLNKATGHQDIYCPCNTGWCLVDNATPYPTMTLTATVTITSTIDDPTLTPTPTTTNTPLPPTATLIPPTATPHPTSTNTEKLWIWIHHESQGKGDPDWDKCMPIAAWNGHSGHTGDVQGGACTP